MDPGPGDLEPDSTCETPEKPSGDEAATGSEHHVQDQVHDQVKDQVEGKVQYKELDLELDQELDPVKDQVEGKVQYKELDLELDQELDPVKDQVEDKVQYEELDLELDQELDPVKDQVEGKVQYEELDLELDQELDPVLDPVLDPGLVWAPTGRHLISGLLGMNIVLLGSALVAGQVFKEKAFKHQEPQAFIQMLIAVSLVWMLWYLLWARKRPGICPHKDHHAGGITVILVLVLFAAFSLLLYTCRIGYLVIMSECKSAASVFSPFIEAPFLGLQTYFLWAHSKDCIHKHKIITRSGLMLILCSDLLLWLNAVTEDTIHEEIELEKQDNPNLSEADDVGPGVNRSWCDCSQSPVCLAFRKGYEVLYPFNIEYYLMAGCMVYVMWKNVGRRLSADHQHQHHHSTQKITLRMVYQGGIIYGPALGALVLVAGITVFIVYQVWVGRPQHRLTAFLVFYGYHLAVMPLMSLCSLVGLLVHRLERRAHEGGHNPTRSLDVVLLVAAALGQLALSYFSLVAALAMGTKDTLGELDLYYSLLSLLELILQNIFIIEGLHRHPKLLAQKKRRRRRSIIFKPKRKTAAPQLEETQADVSLLDRNTPAPPAAPEHDGKRAWTKRAIQEICSFLILCNIMLWVIPAFGVHPQFENGLGKQFFGFSAWFVLVNLGQPLSVFYRMHSVGALMELLIVA